MTATAPTTGIPPTASGVPQADRHRRATQEAQRATSTRLTFDVGRSRVELLLPPPDKLVFYAGVAGLAVAGVLDWPIALVTGLGHLLSDDQHNRTVQALGEALDAAA